MSDRQLMHMAAKQAELLMALEEIAMKKKLDGVAALSMRNIARAALKDAGILVESKPKRNAA